MCKYVSTNWFLGISLKAKEEKNNLNIYFYMYIFVHFLFKIISAYFIIIGKLMIHAIISGHLSALITSLLLFSDPYQPACRKLKKKIKVRILKNQVNVLTVRNTNDQ